MDFPFKNTNLSAIHNRNLQQRTIVVSSNRQVIQPFIKQHFAKYGTIEDLYSTNNNQLHYILFENQNQAKESLNAAGQSLTVQLYQSANAGQTRAVCIINVPLDTNEDYVSDCFQKFGKVNYVKLNRNLDGDLTGKGTVSFLDDSSYQHALREGLVQINTNQVCILKSFDQEINKNIQKNKNSSFKKKRERRTANKQKKESQQSIQNIKKLKFANNIEQNMEVNLDNIIQIQRRRMTKKIKKLKKNNVDVIKGINKFKNRVKMHLDQTLFQKPSEMKQRREKRVKIMEKNRKQGSKIFKPKNNNNLSQILE